jgi:hypothetical protein
MDSNSWEYQQRAIDVEIKSLEASIRALKYRRNALAPISSVPAEVMAVIFFLLRSGKPNIHVVLRVAHVCNRWRKITLDCPLLWTHIDFSTITPSGATEILARAEMAPLYLEANVRSRHWGNARFLAFQKELQTHTSHIYHLSVSAERSHLNKTVEGLISPAPALEYLSLSVNYRKELLQVSVPDTLFDGTAPKLSSLHLSKCDISWKSPLLKGLKNLEITTLSAGARPSLTDWLDALDKMPQLEWLSLDSASPHAPDFSFDIERTVTLPLLAKLDISASAADCGLVLVHLILPTLTSLCITTTGDRPTIQKLLLYVVQHAHGPQDTQPLQSALIHSNHYCVGVLAWPTPNIGLSGWRVGLSARVSLSVTCEPGDTDNLCGIIEAAMAALPLGSLLKLTTSCKTYECNEMFWHRCAPRWPLLTHVHVANRAGYHGFRRALQDDRRREDPLLPLLTHLEVIDVNLTKCRVKQLCDILMIRVEQGVPLEVLGLHNCFTTDVAAANGQLRKFVANVHDLYFSSPAFTDPDSNSDDSSE